MTFFDELVQNKSTIIVIGKIICFSENLDFFMNTCVCTIRVTFYTPDSDEFYAVQFQSKITLIRDG